MIKLPKPTGVLTQSLPLVQDFAATMTDLVQDPHTVLLLSGSHHDTATTHVLAWNPWLTLRTREKRATLTMGNRETVISEDPFSLIDTILAAGDSPLPADLPVPFGLFGYLGYELKNRIEDLPDTVLDDLNLPEACLMAPRVLAWAEKEGDTLFLAALILSDESPLVAQKALDLCTKKLCHTKKTTAQAPDPAPFRSGFTKASYKAAVSDIQNRIQKGEVYQVNLSQRYARAFSGNPFALFQHMYGQNPAPFFAYVEAGDHQVLSTSPERFLRVKGGIIETRPIKGTRPRGTDAKEDQKFYTDLKGSTKDAAELSMIVDLMRNDLGKIAETGSVRVTEHRRITPWTNVFHQESTITAKKRENVGAGEILRATFPPGSVTGCPKIRSMMVIDRLEPVRRNVYTGAIGYLGFQGDLDLNVAIRTVICKGGTAFFSTGGGVVWDSIPGEEYRETLHKAATFFRAMDTDPDLASEKTTPLSWQDGFFTRTPQVSIQSPGLRHGNGVFTTICIQEQAALHFEDHIARFRHSAPLVTGKKLPRVNWHDILSRLLSETPLSGKTAAFHLTATDCAQPLLSVAATLTPWTPPPLSGPRGGLVIATHPAPFFSPLSRFKTCNYRFFSMAREEAQKKGADEALILSPENLVMEGAASSIVLIRGNTVLIPEANALDGITRKQVLRYLETQKMTIRTEPIFPSDLFGADLVLFCSSLRGPMMGDVLDGQTLPCTHPGLIPKLRSALGYA